jgi:uncharacterized membrane protein YfcA
VLNLELAFVLAAAFGAGLIDAMAGGGGLIMLPALFAAYPQVPHPTLLGTSKVASIAGSASAIARYAGHVRLDWPLVTMASVAAFIASLGGAWIATQISPTRFRAVVPVILVAVVIYTLLHRDFGSQHEPRRRGRDGHAYAALGSAAIGAYDGFFGPGTGSFLVFMFVRGFGFDFLHATASAKVVNAAANAAAILMFGITGKVYWLLGLAMAACTMLGAQIGSHLAIRRGSGFVRIVFLLVVGSLIAKTALDAWHAAH